MNNDIEQNQLLAIVVTYNGVQWINRCLDSLLNSSIPLSVYIIDNKSTDDTVSIIKEQYPEFMLYESNENLGFGGANNIGLRYAIENDFDYVYLLNQDAWVMPTTIEVMVAANKKNPEYGILSPLQTNAEMNRLDASFLARCSSRESMLLERANGESKGIFAANFVMAAHWLISKACLRDVGEFSSLFFHYGEDNNYIHRTIYWGYKIGVETSVVGVHDREFRARTKEKDIYLSMPFYLVEISDINKSFGAAAFRAIRKVGWRILRIAIKYRDMSILSTYIPKLFIFGKVRKDRAKNKIRGIYFKK